MTFIYKYAFQGQELDGETGMEAFQLRLWDGRIGRWLSPDPYGQHFSPYAGMGNNPVSHIDPDGGYETWLGAFFGWVGGGFKGSVISNPAGENNTNASRNYGVLLKEGSFKTGSGNNLGEITLPYIRYHDKPSSSNWNWNWFKDHSSGDPLWGNGRDGGGDDRKIGKFGENYGGIDVTNMTSSVGVSPTKNVALELGRRGVEFWDYYNNIKEKVVEPLLSEGVKKDTFYL